MIAELSPERRCDGEFPVCQETGDKIDRFLRSPEPELPVRERLRSGSERFPDGSGRAALSEMLLEEK